MSFGPAQLSGQIVRHHDHVGGAQQGLAADRARGNQRVGAQGQAETIAIIRMALPLILPDLRRRASI